MAVAGRSPLRPAALWPRGAAPSRAELRCCIECGDTQPLPALPPGQLAECRRCGMVLRRTWSAPLAFALAATPAALLLWAIGATAVLATVERVGQVRTATLLSSASALADAGLWEVAILVAATTMLAPLLVMGSLLAVLIGLRAAPHRRWVARLFAVQIRMRPWAMVDVFLVGYFVAYSKLGALATMTPGPGFYALAAYTALSFALSAVLDPQAVWEAMGTIEPPPPAAAREARRPGPAVIGCETCGLACEGGSACPRCGSALERRRPGNLAVTAALSAAGLVLYVPAMLLPVLTIAQLGRGEPSTIAGAVRGLASANEYLLAAIVFIASIFVPVSKLLGLGILLYVARIRRARYPRQLAVLYRIIEQIGRWSMIDVFMEGILSSLVQFGQLATVRPEAGAVSFASVVVLTMIAAEHFDPRLVWDRARPRAHPRAHPQAHS